jgi:hypothetical protein
MKTNLTANDKRTLKSKIAAKLEAAGFSVSGTDSATILLYTDKPVNATTKMVFPNCRHPYSTSWTNKMAIEELV